MSSKYHQERRAKEGFPFRVETKLTEEKEDIPTRWTVWRWAQENLSKDSFKGGVEYIDDRRRHEEVYYFKTDTDAVLFKIWWGSCGTG